MKDRIERLGRHGTNQIREIQEILMAFADSIAKLQADVNTLAADFAAANAGAAAQVAAAVAAKDAADAAAVDAVDAAVVAALPAVAAPVAAAPAPAAS